MALEQKLSVRMSQRLVMTPSLQQAIKLLQMSKLELVEEVQQELVENPVLEEGQEASLGGRSRKPRAARTRSLRPIRSTRSTTNPTSQDVDPATLRARHARLARSCPSFENTLATKPLDLADHLTWQLDLSTSDPTVQEIRPRNHR